MITHAQRHSLGRLDDRAVLGVDFNVPMRRMVLTMC